MTPTLEISITRSFEAEHSLPGVGVPARHAHRYTVEAGYAHAIDAALGCARPMQDAEADLERVISRVEGRYLNDVLPGPPTAEVLACWMLAQMAPYWEWIAIRAYDGFRCRLERKHLAPWLKTLRAAQ